MKIFVKFPNGKKKTCTLSPGSIINDVFRTEGLKPDLWIAVRNDEIIPIDEHLLDGDEVKLINVASGG